MDKTRFIKIIKSVVFVCLASVFVLIFGFAFIACDRDIKYDDAVRIAKRDFKCDKVLWIASRSGLILREGFGDGDTVYRMRSHYAYYVVGEKEGTEVYIVIPSDPILEDPYTTTWGLNYTFTEIVERFNEHGASYVADVPDDYYSQTFDKYISLRSGKGLKGMTSYYDVGGDDDEFYERLDTKAVFEYSWEEEGYYYSVIVAQEDGELTSYERKEKVGTDAYLQ
ncbi:MAG: hypothetical protein J1F39_07655 [Clostridiales bacterium]|nr:hypothetical protein [Clostridiales bacterium]